MWESVNNPGHSAVSVPFEYCWKNSCAVFKTLIKSRPFSNTPCTILQWGKKLAAKGYSINTSNHTRDLHFNLAGGESSCAFLSTACTQEISDCASESQTSLNLLDRHFSALPRSNSFTWRERNALGGTDSDQLCFARYWMSSTCKSVWTYMDIFTTNFNFHAGNMEWCCANTDDFWSL